MIQIVIERGRKWKISELQPKTIALDGAVEGPHIDSDNEIYSFDHHGDCIRGVTLSTAEQVRDFLLLGLESQGYKVLINDIDLDTALSSWLLEYPGRVQEPLISRLVHVAGRQDAHCGAYPVSGDPSVEVLDWIAEPEITLKDGGYQNLTNDQLKFIMEAIWRRIEQYADGKVPPEITAAEGDEGNEDYEVVRKGTGWRLVKFNAPRSMRGLARDGINRWVGYREVSTDGVGSLVVSVGKRSDVVTGFPVGPVDKKGTILHALREQEPQRADKDDDWGGGSTIGGSPRNSDGIGTTLTPDQIFDIVEGVVTGSYVSNEKVRALKKKRSSANGKKEPSSKKET